MGKNQDPNAAQAAVEDAPDEELDLDRFMTLSYQGAGAPGKGQPAATAFPMPSADRVVVVGIVVDDSGSMRGLEKEVRKGLELAVEAFRGAKGSDFYLVVQGFNRNYFQGFLSGVGGFTWDPYTAYVDITPLITVSISVIEKVRQMADKYRNAGISASVAMLIMTDGAPNGESLLPKHFVDYIQANDYIVGMGIRHGTSDLENEIFENLFRNMGIKTPSMTTSSDPSSIRHAINQFSRSVASIGVGKFPS